MSLTKTQASCKCGASISTAFTSELTNWLGQHQQCLISQPKREPLTDDKVREVYRNVFDSPTAPRIYGLAERFARAIEAAHGIKENT